MRVSLRALAQLPRIWLLSESRFEKAFPPFRAFSSAMTKVVAPFGSWKSDITSENFDQGNCRKITELALDPTDFGKDTIYWLEEKREDGRGVVYSASIDSKRVAEPIVKEWTPYPFDANSQVHEYGGGCLCVRAGTLYFMTVNNVYRQKSSSDKPDPLAAAQSGYRFAEPVVALNSVYCIREDHGAGGSEAVNTLVRLAPAEPTVTSDASGHADYKHPLMQVVATGADFYACAAVSPSGKYLSWMQWNHPNMPWDATEIWICDLDKHGAPIDGSNRKLLGDGKTNFMQPDWGAGDTLFCIADSTDWWNVYVVDVQNGKLLRNVYPTPSDIGYARWIFGSHNRFYALELDSGTRILLSSDDKLLLLDWKNEQSKVRQLNTGYTLHHSLFFGRDGAIYAIADAPNKPTAVIRYDLATDEVCIIRETRDGSQLDQGNISIPETVEFPCSDGETTVSGYFYPPKNKHFQAPPNTLPPVLLKAHGGPTARTENALDLRIQFYTSRGFAVFDVNYRGSTGRGRVYRDLLDGYLGVRDVDDVCQAAKFLASQGRVAGDKLCVQGQSAGGYLVLQAILRPNLFNAASSWYGISDVSALMSETHKFESRYDLFAGRQSSSDIREKIHAERSPINRLDEIACPVIFFQGLDDKVVPPNQAEVMFEAVKKKNLPTALVLFEKEGHGFKKKANVQLALEGTYCFLCKVLGIEPVVDETVVDKMDIHNLPKSGT